MKDTLIERREVVSAKFDEQLKQKQAIEEELLRLQGEYRTLTALIEEEEAKGKDTSTTINATPEKEKK